MEPAVEPNSVPPAVPAALPPDAAVDLTGKTFGDFRILRLLGRGGMGQVYLAEQLSLKRQVALKIMRPDLAANAVALKRFQLEAEAVARVTHANIVQVYAVGQTDGLHYMALEYVDGRNLREYLAKKGPPELLQALSILRQVAAGLQRASELGIVHRDIKPENILLTRKGEVKVADFGLSRCFGVEQQPLNLTQSGVSMGTPLYMSPEQVQGKEVDPRTDIYALGITAYHLLAGQPPFTGTNAFEVALQHVNNEPAPLQQVRPDLPAQLCVIIHKMMAKQPEQRYQTARELLKDLTTLREGLSGKTGLVTQHISFSQEQPSLAPASSVKLPSGSPALRALPPASKRRWWLVAAVSVTLAAALALGAWLRVRQDRTHEQAAVKPADTATYVEPPRPALAPDPREAALWDTVKKPAKLHEPALYREQVDQAVQLAVLYLEQRRLKEAEDYFRGLRERPPGPENRVFNALGRLGQALVLAFRDEAKESIDLFRELEKARGPEKPKLPLENRPVTLMAKYPEYFLLHAAALRPIIAAALTHNAVNMAPEPLPEALERLRKPSPGSPKS